MDDAGPDDYYAWLGVEATADNAQLRRAWRRLALQWHPELIVDSEAAAQGGIATIAMRVPILCPACVADVTVPCNHPASPMVRS